MSVSITETGIDAAQLRKLRKARGVVFNAKRGTDRVYGSIRMIAVDDSELTLDCPASITHAGGWGDQARNRRSDFTEAFEYIQAARFHTEWQTIAQLIRVGDKLTLRFQADYHTNSLCDAAGLHADTLTLQVDRGEWGQGGKRFHFYVEYRVTLDNSARMIR